ncbi:hypothetical protein [Bergeriella denitrificans]|uniref:hypothetical protein n=1 Tax=Bergeriella denitrificans TaxID=494 RepID=UPI0012E721AD|nr:hypothetical protein [Bergeriella denitrificans]
MKASLAESRKFKPDALWIVKSRSTIPGGNQQPIRTVQNDKSEGFSKSAGLSVGQR